MNNSMNFTLFNRIKPQPKQEETPTPSWDQAFEVSKDIEETVLLAEAPAVPARDGLPESPFPHVAVGAPEPRRMTVTVGETHETQPDIEAAMQAAITTAHEQLEQRYPQVNDPQEVNLSQATQAELVSKIAAANEEIAAATEPEPEVTPPKEDNVGWFTVIISLFFGLAVFMFKHAATLVITFFTYVDPETEAKWTTKKQPAAAES